MFIAFTSRSQQLFGDILPWLLILIVVAVAGWIVIMMIRRLLDPSESTASPGFTLDDLRKLHDAGELSDEEFEKARSVMIGRLKATGSDDDTGSRTLDSDSSST